MGESGYYIYENWTLEKAVIHHAACRSVRLGTPVTTNGTWYGPYLSRSDAHEFAKSLSRALTRDCKLPGLRELTGARSGGGKEKAMSVNQDEQYWNIFWMIVAILIIFAAISWLQEQWWFPLAAIVLMAGLLVGVFAIIRAFLKKQGIT